MPKLGQEERTVGVARRKRGAYFRVTAKCGACAQALKHSELPVVKATAGGLGALG